MTKALICLRCSDISAPYPDPARGWRRCPCGAAASRWRDPAAGLLDIRSIYGPDNVVVLGLANPFLTAACTGRPWGDTDAVNEEWRLLHDRVCEDIPANYLFSERRRQCWAVVIRPGETGDIRYVEGDEATPGSSMDRAASS